MSAPAVFLDANVLYTGLVRRILLNAAAAGLLQPHWSQRVLDEWQIAVAGKQGPRAEMAVIAARKAMNAAFPDALLPEEPEIQKNVHLPDRADEHVAAAAAGSDVLLTFNMRDFPNRRLRKLGFEVRHPDSYLWQLLSSEPEALEPAIRAAAEEMGIEPADMIQALKRAQLRRLGKMMAERV